jgi:hypothetical protein
MMNEVEEGNYSWDPQEYDFNPYELTMQALKEDENEAEDKKKSGRSKRLSIVCQVKSLIDLLMCCFWSADFIIASLAVPGY